MDNKEKGFWKGIAIGIFSTTIAFALLFGLKITQMTIQSTNKTSNAAYVNDELLQKIGKITNLIDKYSLYELEDETLVDGIYKGLVSGLGDVYSTYYNEEEYNLLMESTSGKYQGIGVMISQHPDTGIIKVVKVFEGGPAAEVGMLPGDILFSVNDVEATGVESSKVVSWIKTNEGDTVNIEVVRDGEYIKFDVERREVEVPTIEYKMLDNNVGYIQVAEFDSVTSEQFIAAVEDLKDKGMQGLVIDLRDNPGGLYNIVCEMLDYILPEGRIVYTEDKDGNIEEEFSDDEKQLDIPYSVIINGSSASASEIFAGTVKDFGIGKVVGETSYGKGVVQRILSLTDGTAVKLTISKYFTSKGVDINKKGVEPDVEVSLPDELKKQSQIDEKDDTQLQKAIEALGETETKDK